METKLQQGFVQIYCGNGKGKTTAAIGQVIRALGQGLRVYMCQFLKPPDSFSGEMAIFNKLGPNFMFRRPSQTSFLNNTFQPEIMQQEKSLILKEIVFAKDLIYNKSFDIFIFDELITALNIGIVEEPILIDILKTRHPQCEIILTGLKPTKTLMDMADLVTEMRLQKHPYQLGFKARKGIEY